MRPLTLHLENFGPFLDETIDFSKLEDNELFLISGKTGSGKSMLFDAIVYALFDEASLESRKGKELRSHFADGKSPMVVTFEFRLKNRWFKVVRQAPFVKEGNKNETKGDAQIFEWKNDTYELIESRIRQGKEYLIRLLGVNASQFRQLFILPQGEFKKFLFSKSSEKQTILRTLFNTVRFDILKKQLEEEIKDEKHQIELRYQTIEQHWQNVETFDDTQLEALKETPSIQTDKLMKYIPEFEATAEHALKQLTKERAQIQNTFEKADGTYRKALELDQNIKALRQEQEKYENLQSDIKRIEALEMLLKQMREVRPLHQILTSLKQTRKDYTETQEKAEALNKQRNHLKQQLEDSNKQLDQLQEDQTQIEAAQQFLNDTQYFYKNLDQYQKAYQRLETLTTEVKQLQDALTAQQTQLKQLESDQEIEQPNYDKVTQLTQALFEIDNEIKAAEHYQTAFTTYKKQKENIKRLTTEQEDNLKALTDLEEKIKGFNTHQLELDNQEAMIKKLQSMLQPGDPCPICGHEITSLSDHVDYEQLRAYRLELEALQQQRDELKGKAAELNTEIKIEQQAVDTFEAEHENTKIEVDIEALQAKYKETEAQKQQQQKQNAELEEKIKHKQQINEAIQSLQIKVTNQQAELTNQQKLIDAFESNTTYQESAAFKHDYEIKEKQVNAYESKHQKLSETIRGIEQEQALNQNSLQSVNERLTELSQQIKEQETASHQEMETLGIQTPDEVQGVLEKMNEKAAIEQEIQTFRDTQVKLTTQIENLKQRVEGQEKPDLESLAEQLQEANTQLEVKTRQVTEHEFKMQANQKEFKALKEHITTLQQELADQEEIFRLSEILSGKNNQKLTLENFVLRYYLNLIIEHANKRFFQMTNQRYKLVRSEAVSAGYSGLDIEVFDWYSNKSRPISTLSGGESFQAALALALGLSEVVQQESGGITLEAIFIDEGFGTLDQETLETALDTLINIKSSGRMVGIISHVSELKQRIPSILQIQSNGYQSNATFKFQ
ncbi:exonuclease subunit SbcC [Staphylococcus simulans]|uniref:exonuclease subunit SbcC n=1 Tax=Staphylococcus simulans TaxID=1286 RepID=UPI00399960B1